MISKLTKNSHVIVLKFSALIIIWLLPKMIFLNNKLFKNNWLGSAFYDF